MDWVTAYLGVSGAIGVEIADAVAALEPRAAKRAETLARLLGDKSAPQRDRAAALARALAPVARDVDAARLA